MFYAKFLYFKSTLEFIFCSFKNVWLTRMQLTFTHTKTSLYIKGRVYITNVRAVDLIMLAVNVHTLFPIFKGLHSCYSWMNKWIRTVCWGDALNIGFPRIHYRNPIHCKWNIATILEYCNIVNRTCRYSELLF